jgi:hypothetical protein
MITALLELAHFIFIFLLFFSHVQFLEAAKIMAVTGNSLNGPSHSSSSSSSSFSSASTSSAAASVTPPQSSVKFSSVCPPSQLLYIFYMLSSNSGCDQVLNQAIAAKFAQFIVKIQVTFH